MTCRDREKVELGALADHLGGGPPDSPFIVQFPGQQVEAAQQPLFLEQFTSSSQAEGWGESQVPFHSLEGGCKALWNYSHTIITWKWWYFLRQKAN